MDRIENGAAFTLTAEAEDPAQETPAAASPVAAPDASSKPPASAAVAPKKLSVFTTNLRQLLNGQMEGRFRG